MFQLAEKHYIMTKTESIAAYFSVLSGIVDFWIFFNNVNCYIFDKYSI